jgi:sugar O-acyltransferase (sialic acid O-acetyltransferase NeuD family)
MSARQVVIIGAGGFAREVEWLLRDINSGNNRFRFLGYVVSDVAKLGDHDSKERIVGDFGWLEAHRNEVDSLALGIGNPMVRAQISAELKTRVPNMDWPPLIHPTAQFDRESCQVEEGVLLCAGVIATVNVRFERFCMVNLMCTIGHEAVIGASSVLNPTVNISGGVVLQDAVLIGTGAQILQYVSVGRGASVGAGAVVNRNVAEGDTVVGIPAKPLVRGEARKS